MTSSQLTGKLRHSFLPYDGRIEFVIRDAGLLSILTLVLLALIGRRGEGRYVPAVIRTN